MRKVLLIEPDYKNKYPPLGLMKIAAFHKNILNDYVRFSKGKLPEAFSKTKWDHVYVTTLFTFEWASTIEAIEYAKTLVNSLDQITVGGIAATMLPEDIFHDTGIHPVTGLLNEAGKLGLPGDECIDQIVPDYSILDEVDYKYPFRDAYFLSATKGCGNKCGFCAVQTLEPTFVPYIDIKERIAEIDERYGVKRDLLLMDNNVLRSPKFNQIIDDIIAAGFGKGATYKNPHTGKTVKRYVDFNQGLDALFLTEEKAKRLGEIALSPARIAFDHVEDREIYERALRLCAKYGITKLSNYVLYNSEAFSGKGRKYAADTPADLYERMRITLDLRDEINKSLPSEAQVAAFSFPMRYIPLSAHERGYVGSMWNAKFLRAVQCMLIPTQGKGVGSRSFFEADFGKSKEEFIRYLCMPERLIAARGEFSKGVRGRAKETQEARALRHAKWLANQSRIKEWNRLFSLLKDNTDSFIRFIGDNEFLPEKTLKLTTDLEKKLYLHYLTTPRLLALFGMIEPGSPSHRLIKEYVTHEYPNLYQDVLKMVVFSETQQPYVLANFLGFFEKDGLKDILTTAMSHGFFSDNLLKKWNKVCKRQGLGSIDFELIRVLKRYMDLCVFDEAQQAEARSLILAMDMPGLASLLHCHLDAFEKAVEQSVGSEQGQGIINRATRAILDSIQLKIDSLLEV